jgi:hypothetical protein
MNLKRPDFELRTGVSCTNFVRTDVRDAEVDQERRQPSGEFWSVASEIWMTLVVAFFVIRILGSETARALLSRWRAH